MPDKYRVIISPRAFDDLESTLDYVAEASPSNSIALIDRLLLEAQSLELFPRRHVEISVEGEEGEFRSMPAPPFRIIYQVLEEQRTIRVMAIRHGARRAWPDND